MVNTYVFVVRRPGTGRPQPETPRVLSLNANAPVFVPKTSSLPHASTPLSYAQAQTLHTACVIISPNHCGCLLTDNVSILSNSDYDKNDSHDPYNILGENDGSIYTEKSMVSHISYYRPEYDQEVECDRQPSAFIRQPVRNSFRYFSS